MTAVVIKKIKIRYSYNTDETDASTCLLNESTIVLTAVAETFFWGRVERSPYYVSIVHVATYLRHSITEFIDPSAYHPLLNQFKSAKTQTGHLCKIIFILILLYFDQQKKNVNYFCLIVLKLYQNNYTITNRKAISYRLVFIATFDTKYHGSDSRTS